MTSAEGTVSKRHALVLQALMREAETIRRDISIVQMHEAGEESATIAVRIGLNVDTVTRILRRRGFKSNDTDAYYLTPDPRRAKASER